MKRNRGADYDSRRRQVPLVASRSNRKETWASELCAFADCSAWRPDVSRRAMMTSGQGLAAETKEIR